MRRPRLRRLCLRSRIALYGAIASVLIAQGCAQTDRLSDVGLLPADHSIVFAAPAGKISAGRGSVRGATAVPEPVVFRFQRVSAKGEGPVHLDLIGSVDQSVRLFAARPGTYRLVEAFLLAKPGQTRWLFTEAPNVLEVRAGEAVYVGTLTWRDTWVEIDNDEAEAKALYKKRLGEFKYRSLRYVTRLVSSTKFSR